MCLARELRRRVFRRSGLRQYIDRVVLYLFGFTALIGGLLLINNPRQSIPFLLVALSCLLVSPVKRILVAGLLVFVVCRGLVGVVLYRQPLGILFALGAGLLLIAVHRYWPPSPAEDKFELPDDAAHFLPDLITVLLLFWLYAALR